MKLTILTNILAGLACSGTVLAQDGSGPEKQLGPFYLQVQSNDSTVNGRYISSCHAGAAIQAACISSSRACSKSIFLGRRGSLPCS